MIKIDILDETYFKNQNNLDRHYDKHILQDFDYDLQMDSMAKEIYNELGNRLSLAKAGKWNSRSDSIVGYVSQNGLTTKLDKDSGLCVVYSYEDDETVSLYKTILKKFLAKANPDSDKNSDFKFLRDIPDEQNGTGTFDYEEFIKEFKIEHRKEFAVSPMSVISINIYVQEDKMETIRKLYSANELSQRVEYPHITLDNVGRLDGRDYERVNKIKKEISKLGSEIKFKVVGYANNGENEAIKVKLLSVPEELSEAVSLSDNYWMTLSMSEGASELDSGLLEFKDVDKQIKSKGILGAKRYRKDKPLFTVKEIVSENPDGRYFEIKLI